jgi:hypothetical protein
VNDADVIMSRECEEDNVWALEIVCLLR